MPMASRCPAPISGRNGCRASAKSCRRFQWSWSDRPPFAGKGAARRPWRPRPGANEPAYLVLDGRRVEELVNPEPGCDPTVN